MDGSYYGDYDGVRALANSASGYGGLGRLGGERGPWSGASGDNRMSQTNFAQRTALQNGPMSLSPASPNSLSAARSAASLASGRSPRGTASLGRSRSSPGLSFSSPLSPGWGGHDYHSARSELLPGASPSFRRDLSTPPASPQMKLAPSPLGAKKKEFSGTGRYNGAPARTLTLTLTLALVLALVHYYY